MEEIWGYLSGHVNSDLFNVAKGMKTPSWPHALAVFSVFSQNSVRTSILMGMSWIAKEIITEKLSLNCTNQGCAYISLTSLFYSGYPCTAILTRSLEQDFCNCCNYHLGSQGQDELHSHCLVWLLKAGKAALSKHHRSSQWFRTDFFSQHLQLVFRSYITLSTVTFLSYEQIVADHLHW